MSKKRIIILGAGLAGLSAAWHLQKKGIDCLLFEKENSVGGLCRSKEINGFTFDLDGHLLHFRHRYAFNLIKSLLGDNLAEHRRSSWVYSHGKYIPYPFQANLNSLPAAIAKECFSGFMATAAKRGSCSRQNTTFFDWINNTFGRGIARHFMIPYNTKFWTVNPRNLTCEWLDGFIPVPSANQIVEGALGKNILGLGYNARFWYPKKGGIFQIPLSFSCQLKNINTNCEVTGINLSSREIEINFKHREKFDYIIYTLPLPELTRLAKKLPEKIISSCKKLKWNSIFNLNLGAEKKTNPEKHWAYFPQKEISFFRIGFPHNFSPSAVPPDKSSFYTEVSYSKNRPVDKDNISLQIKEDLKKLGILNQNDRICAQDINDIKYGYPIYDKNYQKTRDAILKYLRQNNIIACGRYGSWRYMSMEGAILDSKKAAEAVSKNI